jgi:hypothetical protein
MEMFCWKNPSHGVEKLPEPSPYDPLTGAFVPLYATATTSRASLGAWLGSVVLQSPLEPVATLGAESTVFPLRSSETST